MKRITVDLRVGKDISDELVDWFDAWRKRQSPYLNRKQAIIMLLEEKRNHEEKTLED